MTELAPCPRCHRHVAVRETACPFCSAAVSGLRAVHHVPAKLVRVAVLTAALVGCSDKKAAEPPPAGSAQGSDDLEKMLDQDVKTAKHDTPADAALDAYAVAEAIDAGVPADAGPTAEEIAHKRAVERKRLEEKRRIKQELDEQRLRNLDRLNAKPYGAPSARRRVV